MLKYRLQKRDTVLRVPFHLKEFEPFSFTVEARTYRYSDVTRLAWKHLRHVPAAMNSMKIKRRCS